MKNLSNKIIARRDLIKENWKHVINVIALIIGSEKNMSTKIVIC